METYSVEINIVKDNKVEDPKNDKKEDKKIEIFYDSSSLLSLVDYTVQGD